MTWSREQYLEMDARHREAMERAYAPWLAEQRERVIRQRREAFEAEQRRRIEDLREGQLSSAVDRALHRDRCIRDVAKEYGVTVAMLKGEGRSKRLVEARWKAFARLQRECGLSTTAIGRLFNRGHSTVVYGLRKWQEMGK